MLIAIALLIGGAPVGGEFRVNGYTTDDQGNPSVAIAPGGRFMVVWESYGQDGDGYGIYAQLFESSGAAVGSEFKVNSNVTGDQRYPSVSCDGSGNFAVAWQSEGDHWDGASYSSWGVYKQMFDSSGNPQYAREILVNEQTAGDQTEPCMAFSSNSKQFVSWTDSALDGSGSGVFLRRYNQMGHAYAVDPVNTYVTGSQSQSAVATDGTGNFVVVWRSEAQDGSLGGIYGQAFSSGGGMDGTEFRVNTYTAGEQQDPAIAMNTTGTTVIVWASDSQDGSGFGVFAQRFDASHLPVASEFQVNTYVTGNQHQPSVAMFPNGSFVVVWSSDGQDGSGYGIYAQQFSAGGTPLGPEFRVNTRTADEQVAPSISATNSLYVIVWTSYSGDGSGHGVYGQMFDHTVIPEFSDVALPVAMTVLVMMLIRSARRRRPGT